MGTSLPLVEAVTTTVNDSSAEVGPVLNKLSFFLFSPTCWLLPPSSVAKDNKMHFGHEEPAELVAPTNDVRNVGHKTQVNDGAAAQILLYKSAVNKGGGLEMFRNVDVI